MSIPPNYYFHWNPTTGLSDSTIDEPRASPATTTTYTLEIRDDFDALVESDEVVVYVSDTLEAGFIIQEYTDSVTFLFENRTAPYDLYATYKWYFGDDDSSSLINPTHEYNLSGDDSTYNVYITLVSSNVCGESTVVDSIAVDTTGAIVIPQSIPIPYKDESLISQGNHSLGNEANNSAKETKQPTADLSLDDNSFLILRPNPFKQILYVDFKLNLLSTEGDIILEVLNMKGQLIRKLPLKRQDKNTISLDLTNESAGNYYVRLVNNKEVLDLKKAIKIN